MSKCINLPGEYYLEQCPSSRNYGVIDKKGKWIATFDMMHCRLLDVHMFAAAMKAGRSQARENAVLRETLETVQRGIEGRFINDALMGNGDLLSDIIKSILAANAPAAMEGVKMSEMPNPSGSK